MCDCTKAGEQRRGRCSGTPWDDSLPCATRYPKSFWWRLSPRWLQTPVMLPAPRRSTAPLASYSRRPASPWTPTTSTSWIATVQRRTNSSVLLSWSRGQQVAPGIAEDGRAVRGERRVEVGAGSAVRSTARAPQRVIIRNEHVREVVRGRGVLRSDGRTEGSHAHGVPARADRPELLVEVVVESVVAVRGRDVGRDPGNRRAPEAVGHGGEHHHARHQPDLRNHRRVPASLGVTADGDL